MTWLNKLRGSICPPPPVLIRLRVFSPWFRTSGPVFCAFIPMYSNWGRTYSTYLLFKGQIWCNFIITILYGRANKLWQTNWQMNRHSTVYIYIIQQQNIFNGLLPFFHIFLYVYASLEPTMSVCLSVCVSVFVSQSAKIDQYIIPMESDLHESFRITSWDQIGSGGIS